MSGHNGMIVQKRMSFLASLVWGLAAILITALLSGTTVAIYALRVVDHKSDGALAFAQQIVGELPEIAESLPPFLADTFDHRRAPEYTKQVHISVALEPDRDHPTRVRPVLHVDNRGDRTIAMLAVRLVMEDEQGMVTQSIEYPATPVAFNVDHGRDLPGPIMPGGTCTFATRSLRLQRNDSLKARVEVTDLRLWEGDLQPRTTGRHAAAVIEHPSSVADQTSPL